MSSPTTPRRLESGTIGPRDADLTTLGCVLEIDGEVAATATGAALLGDPAGCVAMLANHLGKHGQRLQAGWTILAGAPTDAKPLGAGTHVRARYSHFGSVSIVGKG